MIHAAPQGTGAALQDKLHCFLHRHEITLYVLMRDGKRTVAAELPLEEGNERAAGPKHIAEPHRHETSAAVPSSTVQSERLGIKASQTHRKSQLSDGLYPRLCGQLQHVQWPIYHKT